MESCNKKKKKTLIQPEHGRQVHKHIYTLVQNMDRGRHHCMRIM